LAALIIVRAQKMPLQKPQKLKTISRSKTTKNALDHLLTTYLTTYEITISEFLSKYHPFFCNPKIENGAAARFIFSNSSKSLTLTSDQQTREKRRSVLSHVYINIFYESYKELLHPFNAALHSPIHKKYEIKNSSKH